MTDIATYYAFIMKEKRNVIESALFSSHKCKGKRQIPYASRFQLASGKFHAWTRTSPA